ncbi:extensin [Aurantiacibacter xanthus]|uniref:Extensin n=1 Tax=Aurantiacibacter xanthus TaxID=1784712 RepID=A0A3A1P3V1_9SPHN|nr:extensin family protein [Aurantiacibacter xanthus]RIV85291.1 extensin [Aurantiacibacter xanthus]
MRQWPALLILASALAGCSMLPDRSGRETSTPRTADSRAVAAPTRTVDRVCMADLGGSGARFTPLPDRYDGNGCSNLGTVQLIALSSDDGELALSNLGAVTCPVSQAFAGWARFGVDRAARQILGAKLARIETYGSYNCRNVAGSSRRSAHATASAIDISGFVLSDGRRISVLDDWDGGSAAYRQFLRTVQASACRRFGTVLGPDYNAAHRNHFHLEGVAEGKSFCR